LCILNNIEGGVMGKELKQKDLVVMLKLEGGGGSDIALKQDVTPIGKGLAKMLALRPVSWRWKARKNEIQYGFIAQEVEKIIPELVNEGVWEDGTNRKFLTASGMMPYVVAALKEQQAQIDRLKKLTDSKKKD
jgi:hypothetical protein